MVNVVEAPGAQKPGSEQHIPRHPEIPQVHAVVQVAEHEDRPSH